MFKGFCMRLIILANLALPVGCKSTSGGSAVKDSQASSTETTTVYSGTYSLTQNTDDPASSTVTMNCSMTVSPTDLKDVDSNDEQVQIKLDYSTNFAPNEFSYVLVAKKSDFDNKKKDDGDSVLIARYLVPARLPQPIYLTSKGGNLRTVSIEEGGGPLDAKSQTFRHRGGLFCKIQ